MTNKFKYVSLKRSGNASNAEVVWALEQYVGKEEAANEEEKGRGARRETEKPDEGV